MVAGKADAKGHRGAGERNRDHLCAGEVSRRGEEAESRKAVTDEGECDWPFEVAVSEAAQQGGPHQSSVRNSGIVRGRTGDGADHFFNPGRFNPISLANTAGWQVSGSLKPASSKCHHSSSIRLKPDWSIASWRRRTLRRM